MGPTGSNPITKGSRFTLAHAQFGDFLQGIKKAVGLGEIFKPMVRNAMSRVGVTKAYQDVEKKVKSIPFVGG